MRLPNDRKLNVARLRRTFLCAEVDVGRCCRSSNASSAHSSDFKQLPLPKRYAATLARELVWECDYRLWTKHGRLGTRPTCLELERAYALLSGPPPINGRGRPIFSGIGPADRADARDALGSILSIGSTDETAEQPGDTWSHEHGEFRCSDATAAAVQAGAAQHPAIRKALRAAEQAVRREHEEIVGAERRLAKGINESVPDEWSPTDVRRRHSLQRRLRKR